MNGVLLRLLLMLNMVSACFCEQAFFCRRIDSLRRSWLEKEFFIRNRLPFANAEENSFRLLHKEGGKVLFSAPHALKHIRNGRVKGADINTGTLALILSEKTRNPVIYSSGISLDPNYYDELPYKQALYEYLSENMQIEFVFDLHGAAAHRDFAVDLGTLHGQSCSAEKIAVIEKNLIKAGLGKISHNFFSGSGQDTVTKYVHKHFPQLCAVQIEINYKLRNGEGLEKIISVIPEIITDLQQ